MSGIYEKDLTKLNEKAIRTGLKLLQEAGITGRMWLAMLKTSLPEREQIFSAWPDQPTKATRKVSTAPGIVYSAKQVGRILGLQCDCSAPVPKALPGEVIVYYGGWSLKALCETEVGQRRIVRDNVFGTPRRWGPGYYRLLLPVQGSANQYKYEQLRQLFGHGRGWIAAQTPLATLALVLHLETTGKNLLRYRGAGAYYSGVCRCAEKCSRGEETPGACVEITKRKVVITDYAEDARDSDLWMAAAQKI